MSGAGTSTENEPSEQDIVREFNARRQRLNEMFTKINELTAEVAEHEMVIAALQPMDKARKCFRLIGEVLVERNVGETMPAVEKHKGNLEGVIETLKTQYKQQEKELTDFQAKYKIRIVNRETGQPIDDEDDANQAARGGKAQGVLVSSS